ncbi:hypothetical protein LSAT2_032140 [Lamellibrachia satsuma]|nr:hypothetical protein LSAT2_032140 [Lamellibrachia satsuma]
MTTVKPEGTTQDWLTRNTVPLVLQTRSRCINETRKVTQFVPVNDITTISYDTDDGGYRNIGSTGSPTTFTKGTRVYLMITPMTFSETTFRLNSQVISVCLAVVGGVLFLGSVIASIVCVITR